MIIKKALKNAGFTLIELIVIIAVLGVLASIALPSFGGLIIKSKEAVDLANLRTLNGVTAAFRAQNPSNGLFEDNTETDDNRMVELINAEYIDEEIQAKKEGASFTWEPATNGNDGRWVYNDGENTDAGEGGSSSTGEGFVINFPGGHKALATGTWAEVLEDAADSLGGGVSVIKGAVYYDDSEEYYIMKSPEWVSSGTVLSTYSRAAKLLTNSLLTPDDVSEVGWVHWTRNFLLTEGMVRFHSDGNLYAYIGENISNTENTSAIINDNWQLLISP